MDIECTESRPSNQAFLTCEEHSGKPALLHRVVREELQPQRVPLRRDDGRQPRTAEEAVLSHLPGAHLGAQRQAVVFAILFGDVQQFVET